MLKLRSQQGDFKLRIHLATGAMLLLLLFLVGFLFRLQVVNQLVHTEREEAQSVRGVRLPGVRGRIFDRNGICMADNRPVYDVAIYLEEVRERSWASTRTNVIEAAESIGAVIGRPAELTYADVKKHMHSKMSLPMVLYRDLNTDELARWSEQCSTMRGVDVLISGSRVYPYGATAAHVLGYVRSDRQMDEAYSPEDDFNFYKKDMVGKSGLEKRFDSELQGRAGSRLLRINVAGFKYGEISYRAPLQGQDLQLTIDLEIQQLAEMALGDDPGSAVVIDPNNGDVLAMVSSPTFDPNDFYPTLTSRVWDQLRNNIDHPMQNKAVAGLFPPGSTFKPITAMAALQRKPAESLDHRDCPGYYMNGRRKMKCWAWRTGGHGDINLEQALKYSCNVYMFKMGLEMGPEPIYEMAKSFGLGRKTGIQVDKELGGLLASPEWMRENKNARWGTGDTCNMSIGQGFLLVTPLQMGMVASTLANQGTLFKPRLIKARRKPGTEDFEEEPFGVKRGRLDWLPESIDLVRRGMWGVINAPDGSAKTAKIAGWEVAGKTGTAQAGGTKKNVWMIGFAPYHNPRYAVAVMVDRGGISGGKTIGPKLKVLMQSLYELEQHRALEDSHAG